MRVNGHGEACGESLKKRLVSFWNSREVYWDSISTSEAAESPQRAKAVSFLPAGGDVLDVACGSAANAQCISLRCRYFGSDISQSGLRRAPRTSLRLVCGDADQLPFGDESFDATISTFALEHCVDPKQMLQEMRRVVRPGGRIVLLGPSWDLPFWYPNALRSHRENRRSVQLTRQSAFLVKCEPGLPESFHFCVLRNLMRSTESSSMTPTRSTWSGAMKLLGT